MSTSHQIADAAARPSRSRILAFVILLVACAPLSSCGWLQNEAFIWDVPAPPVQVPTGSTVGS